MNLCHWIWSLFHPTPIPRHLRHGQMGERAARKALRKLGMKFLVANFKSGRGEIDLIFRDRNCLVFVEVKTRAADSWSRPAASVDARKRLLLTKTAFDYLYLLRYPKLKFRFDIVEVLIHEDRVADVRHLLNAFQLYSPYRYR